MKRRGYAAFLSAFLAFFIFVSCRAMRFLRDLISFFSALTFFLLDMLSLLTSLVLVLAYELFHERAQLTRRTSIQVLTKLYETSRSSLFSRMTS